MGLVAQRVTLLLGALAATIGCGDDKVITRPSTTTATGGAGGQADLVCGVLEAPSDSGTCVAVGVEPDACGPGFVWDEHGGCVASLPEEPCPPGSMAVMGEQSCRPVSPCGTGQWGDIPVEADTDYVDGSYGGGDSDGSAAKPWTTIGQAVNAAPAHGLIAIAEGSYGETIVVSDRPRRLWGRCPELVEIVAAAGAGVIVLQAGASGTELHDLAVRSSLSDEAAVAIVDAQDVRIDRVWIHDSVGRGIDLFSQYGDIATATVDRSLIEGTTGVGILVVGADLSMDSTVVRDILPVDGSTGTAIFARFGAPNAMARRAALSVTSSLLEGNRSAAIVVTGADAHVDASLVRDTLPQPSDMAEGFGIVVSSYPPYAERGSLALSRSVLERNHFVGLLAEASDLIVTDSVVRDTLPRASDSTRGMGITLQQDGELASSSLELTHAQITGNRGAGVLVAGSTATIGQTLIRETTGWSTDGSFGDGLMLVTYDLRANAVVTESRIEANARAGISSFGADGVVDNTQFECNAFPLDGEEHFGSSVLSDDGGNVCGCGGEYDTCLVLSANLKPPPPP